ncbi:MAG: hypothetical protein RMA76_22455 [Deltaproteobacteria bacterium]|jgi:hypothetical protein
MSTAPDRETLARYVLGVLPDDDVSAVDDFLFFGEDGEDTLRLVEDELIEAYLANTLAASDRTAFEARFSTSDALRARLDFHRALLERLDAEPQPQPRRTLTASWLDWFRRPLVLGFAAAAAAVLLAVVIGLGPDPVTPQTLVLRASELRDDTGTVPIAAAGVPIDVVLRVPVEETFDTYQLRLRRGSTVLFERDGRRGAQDSLQLRVEPEQVPVGNYELVLSTLVDGNPVDIAVYPFVVRPREKDAK